MYFLAILEVFCSSEKSTEFTLIERNLIRIAHLHLQRFRTMNHADARRRQSVFLGPYRMVTERHNVYDNLLNLSRRYWFYSI